MQHIVIKSEPQCELLLLVLCSCGKVCVCCTQAAVMAYMRGVCFVQLQQESLQVKTGSTHMVSWRPQAPM